MPDNYDRRKELEARAAGVARREAHRAALRPHRATVAAHKPRRAKLLAPEDVAGVIEGMLLNLITPEVRRKLSKQEIEQRRAELLRALEALR